MCATIVVLLLINTVPHCMHCGSVGKVWLFCRQLFFSPAPEGQHFSAFLCSVEDLACPLPPFFTLLSRPLFWHFSKPGVPGGVQECARVCGRPPLGLRECARCAAVRQGPGSCPPLLPSCPCAAAGFRGSAASSPVFSRCPVSLVICSWRVCRRMHGGVCARAALSDWKLHFLSAQKLQKTQAPPLRQMPDSQCEMVFFSPSSWAEFWQQFAPFHSETCT